MTVDFPFCRPPDVGDNFMEMMEVVVCGLMKMSVCVNCNKIG